MLSDSRLEEIRVQAELFSPVGQEVVIDLVAELQAHRISFRKMLVPNTNQSVFFGFVYGIIAGLFLAHIVMM